ncbi:hypothetical protein [Caballeronia sp. M1242]|uniref:hypothetical protein n=1 Tax=Caballeronia sp. M1242 TaxID=2814653 RepID=UPI00353050D9
MSFETAARIRMRARERLAACLPALDVLPRRVAVARAAQRVVAVHALRALMQIVVADAVPIAALPDVLHALTRRLIEVLPGALLERLRSLRAGLIAAAELVAIRSAEILVPEVLPVADVIAVELRVVAVPAHVVAVRVDAVVDVDVVVAVHVHVDVVTAPVAVAP